MKVIYTFNLIKSDESVIANIEYLLEELAFELSFIGIDVIQDELKIEFKNILINEDEIVLMNILKRFIE